MSEPNKTESKGSGAASRAAAATALFQVLEKVSLYRPLYPMPQQSFLRRINA